MQFSKCTFFLPLVALMIISLGAPCLGQQIQAGAAAAAASGVSQGYQSGPYGGYSYGPTSTGSAVAAAGSTTGGNLNGGYQGYQSGPYGGYSYGPTSTGSAVAAAGSTTGGNLNGGYGSAAAAAGATSSSSPYVGPYGSYSPNQGYGYSPFTANQGYGYSPYTANQGIGYSGYYGNQASTSASAFSAVGNQGSGYFGNGINVGSYPNNIGYSGGNTNVACVLGNLMLQLVALTQGSPNSNVGYSQFGQGYGSQGLGYGSQGLGYSSTSQNGQVQQAVAQSVTQTTNGNGIGQTSYSVAETDAYNPSSIQTLPYQGPTAVQTSVASAGSSVAGSQTTGFGAAPVVQQASAATAVASTASNPGVAPGYNPGYNPNGGQVAFAGAAADSSVLSS